MTSLDFSRWRTRPLGPALLSALACALLLAVPSLAGAATISYSGGSAGVVVYAAGPEETLDTDVGFRITLWKLPEAAVAAQWRDLILHHTGAYLAHRFDVFRWTFMTPDITQCLPAQLGVQGPPAMIEELELAADPLPREKALYGYLRPFYRTPVFSHLAWAVAALLVAVGLLVRRAPADVPMAALMLGALAFTASFLPISVACDYRYLYLVDLAAIAGLIYLALDVRLIARVRGRMETA